MFKFEAWVEYKLGNGCRVINSPSWNKHSYVGQVLRPNNALPNVNVRFGESKTAVPKEVDELGPVLRLILKLVRTPKKKLVLSLLTGVVGAIGLVIPPIGIGFLMFSASMMLWAAQDYFWPEHSQNTAGRDHSMKKVFDPLLHQKLIEKAKSGPTGNQAQVFLNDYHTLRQTLPAHAEKYKDLLPEEQKLLNLLIEHALCSGESLVEDAGKKIATHYFEPFERLNYIIQNGNPPQSCPSDGSVLPKETNGSNANHLTERERTRQRPVFFREILMPTPSGTSQILSISVTHEGKNLNYSLVSNDSVIGSLNIFDRTPKNLNLICKYRIQQEKLPRESLLKQMIHLAVLKILKDESVNRLEFVIEKKDQSLFKEMGFHTLNHEGNFLTPQMVLEGPALLQLRKEVQNDSFR